MNIENIKIGDPVIYISDFSIIREVQDSQLGEVVSIRDNVVLVKYMHTKKHQATDTEKLFSINNRPDLKVRLGYPLDENNAIDKHYMETEKLMGSIKEEREYPIIKMLTTYFDNRDKIKQLRRKRSNDLSCGNRDAWNRSCYCQIEEGEPIDTTNFCSECKEVHLIYLEIKKLSYENRSIMLRLRGIVNRSRK